MAAGRLNIASSHVMENLLYRLCSEQCLHKDLASK